MFKFVTEIYGFTSNADPKASFLKAKASLVAKSKRAKEIIDLVEADQHVIEVVIGTSVGQDSAFRGAVGTETVSKLVWDPTFDFPILVDPQQVTNMRKIGVKEVAITKTVAKKALLIAEIVLIHELGHAAQYLGELPSYKSQFAAGKPGIAVIEADNLLRNEWPICKDYGLACRSNYMHYNGSPDTAKWQAL